MAEKTHKLTVLPGGEIRAIYGDDLQKIIAPLGDVTTRRASHVETWADLSPAARDWIIQNRLKGQVTFPGGVPCWYSDLLPVGGPVLGPFAARDDALAAEVAWLNEHMSKLTLPE